MGGACKDRCIVISLLLNTFMADFHQDLLFDFAGFRSLSSRVIDPDEVAAFVCLNQVSSSSLTRIACRLCLISVLIVSCRDSCRRLSIIYHRQIDCASLKDEF